MTSKLVHPTISLLFILFTRERKESNMCIIFQGNFFSALYGQEEPIWNTEILPKWFNPHFPCRKSKINPAGP